MDLGGARSGPWWVLATSPEHGPWVGSMDNPHDSCLATQLSSNIWHIIIGEFSSMGPT